jgi:hypothetical protein
MPLSCPRRPTGPVGWCSSVGVTVLTGLVNTDRRRDPSAPALVHHDRRESVFSPPSMLNSPCAHLLFAFDVKSSVNGIGTH